MAQLLITGGAGFISSHACLVLLEAGHQLLVLDDFSNSSVVALGRFAELSGVSGEIGHFLNWKIGLSFSKGFRQ